MVLAGDRVDVGLDLLPSSSAHFSTPSETRELDRFKEKGDLGSAVTALEREMIQQGLISTHWNKSKLATRLGVSRTTLIKKIKEYAIDDGGDPEGGEGPSGGSEGEAGV